MNKRKFIKFTILGGIMAYLNPSKLFCKEKMMNNFHKGPFGSCCNDLSDAMTKPQNSLLFKDENGIFYLTVGYIHTEQGTGWFDQAIIFCPFCGKKLQNKEEIKQKAQEEKSTQPLH